MDKIFIGIDFGTDSARALAADSHGRILAEAVQRYSRWAEGKYADAAAFRFRQHPLDYIEAMEAAVREVASSCDAARVCGIGLDTTASTPCLTSSDGVPLALSSRFSEEPDAMFILWKDHTTTAEATQITETAKTWGGPDFTAYEGGDYSAEWLWSKALHVLRTNPDVRTAAHGVVELGDWIPSLLTDAPALRGRCAAGHKGMWHASWGGFPPEAFFAAVDPLLVPLRRKFGAETATADVPVGRLSPEWARRLGLPAGIAVAGGAIDCHVGAVGAGIRPGVMVKVCGTSTCDILVVPSAEKPIPGICGQVDGSVVPGLVGLEAGQSSFGDVYAWLGRFLGYAGKVSIADIERDAAAIPPGASGVAALDWFNGRRTPYADVSRTGALTGLTLGTTPPAVFAALAEATVFGAKAISDHFAEQGVVVNKVVATGGIARKSPYIMQMLADVFGLPIKVSACDQTCALGGAIFAAAASKAFGNVPEAMDAMAAGADREYRPDPARVAAYAPLYARYRDLAIRLG